ncbi:Fic family protein [candidate division WOR-3 bacterium]|nr:Fic family protein [candidate division WOR-3 bacterium]
MKPPYEITKSILKCYGEIKEILGQTKSLLLVKPEAKLRKQNRIKTIYSSLAIEGNTLDMKQITAIIDNKRIIGPKKDVIEVKNAIKAYNELSKYNSHSRKDFLKAHSLLMNNLIKRPGEYRRRQIGIVKGTEVKHIAPGYNMIPKLIDDLFHYLKKDIDLDIIKSCVFHYEVEFIHPFEDGNGRIGRLWQTRILMDANPLFEYVPIEDTIKKNQQDYYRVLENCDNKGNSTEFIEFMLDIINQTLKDTIKKTKALNIDYKKRTEYALSELKDWFDRKDYLTLNKGISSATASRDLKRLLEEGKIVSKGSGRMTLYSLPCIKN